MQWARGRRRVGRRGCRGLGGVAIAQQLRPRSRRRIGDGGAVLEHRVCRVSWSLAAVGRDTIETRWKPGSLETWKDWEMSVGARRDICWGRRNLITRGGASGQCPTTADSSRPLTAWRVRITDMALRCGPPQSPPPDCAATPSSSSSPGWMGWMGWMCMGVTQVRYSVGRSWPPVSCAEYVWDSANCRNARVLRRFHKLVHPITADAATSVIGYGGASAFHHRPQTKPGSHSPRTPHTVLSPTLGSDATRAHLCYGFPAVASPILGAQQDRCRPWGGGGLAGNATAPTQATVRHLSQHSRSDTSGSVAFRRGS